jgi:Na+/proline symporter
LVVVVVSFSALSLYFLAMLVTGVWVAGQASGTDADFLLGGRRLGAGVTALSAGAAEISA